MERVLTFLCLLVLNIMEPVANTLYAANHMSHFTGEDQNPKEAQKSVLEKGIGMKIIDDDPPQKSFCG